MPGCNGKDERAMLRLSNSYAFELRSRLSASADWYTEVKKGYQAK